MVWSNWAADAARDDLRSWESFALPPRGHPSQDISGTMMGDARETIRLDKWLWQARFFKTRTLAASVVKAGNVRVNSLKVAKPAFQVGEGDGITFVQEAQTRVVVVQACGVRRGPAPEAQGLYLDKTVFEEKIPRTVTPWGKGRPTKKDRRTLDLSRKPPLE